MFLFLNKKQQKVFNLFVEYINCVVFFNVEFNKNKFVNKNTLFYTNLNFYKTFFEHYSLFKFLIKCFKFFNNKSNKQKVLTLINRILKDNKQYIVLNNYNDILLFIAFCNEYKGTFISYKKDLLNLNKHNYIKKYKNIDIYMINLKLTNHDLNNRYFIVSYDLYNEYLQTINCSYFNLKLNKSFKIIKLYLLSKYNYMFVQLSLKNSLSKRQYYNKNLNKSTKTIYLSEIIYFIKYYHDLIKLNEYNYYIVNNNSIFNHVRDYFTYYQKDNITLIEYLQEYNYNIVNDISKNINLDNTIHYKVILNNINKDIKFNNKLKEYIIFLLQKDIITFNDIQLLIKYQKGIFNNNYYNKVFEKYFTKRIK